MSHTSTHYIAKIPNDKGFVDYTAEEHSVWGDLYDRQIQIIKDRACDEFIEGVEILNMTHNQIPQIPDMNAALKKATGWSVYPVPALIGFEEFFRLLANRHFPAATFIRTREDFDYIKEPDIFHEFFGHCPMLTNQVYADFMQLYGEIGLKADAKDRVMLARLYWFTVEFGLIQTTQGLRIYGGGILSSKNETIYAVESETPIRKQFDALDALRTPYRIDIIQPLYFIIQSYQELFELAKTDLMGLICQARQLGMHKPVFEHEKEMKFC